MYPNSWLAIPIRRRPEAPPIFVFSWMRSPAGTSWVCLRMDGEMVCRECVFPERTSMTSRGRSCVPENTNGSIE